MKNGSADAVWRELAQRAHYNAIQLAQLYHVSPRQLRRRFQETKGCSPQKWLDAFRIQVARQLITEGVSIKELTFELGFKQTSHFYRHFRKFMQMTPRQFRETSQENHGRNGYK